MIQTPVDISSSKSLFSPKLLYPDQQSADSVQ